MRIEYFPDTDSPCIDLAERAARRRAAAALARSAGPAGALAIHYGA